MNAGAVVLLSGGMDSTVLCARTVVEYDRVLALSVDYGQRHVREVAAASRVAEYLRVEHQIIDLTTVGALLPSALTADQPVPHGHYADESMRVTVVPNRNAIFLMVAAGIAAARDMEVVRTAVHAGDHPVYPDCRPEFIRAASAAAHEGTGGRVWIDAPYVHASKADICADGPVWGAPLHLTWSCYEGGDVHCGRCGTCVERREAFLLAGVHDRTTYSEA